MKAVLSNMGFILQLTGIFMLIPIIVSFSYSENLAGTALLITAIVFFMAGFLLNAMCEKKELNFKQSSSLIVLVFVFLSILGAIPYFFLNITNADTFFVRLTDSVFESASGFATVGYSVISDVDSVPRSIILYRALTQFIGGIGIVYILLLFLYPEEKLKSFSRSIGLPENGKIKRTLILILGVYIVYAVLMVAISYLFGYRDILNSVSFVFSALSTGGFSPVTDITPLISNGVLRYVLIMSMLFGAMNFIALAGLFKFKFREFIRSEVPIFILFVISAITLIKIFYSLSFYDVAFHVVSIMTTTGFGYIDVSSLAVSLKIIFILLMFIGGTSLSTAGGIKMFRFILIIKTIKKAIVESITEKEYKVKLFSKEYSNAELIQHISMVLLMIIIVFISTFIFSLYGYSMLDSAYETTSAITGTGLGVGVIGPALALELKWLVIGLMILGRVEILAFFIMLSRQKEKSGIE